MANSRSKPVLKIGHCVFCGSYGPLTRDHVIPKLLFERKEHSSIRVPACSACQKGKGRGEQILWKMVNLDIEGEKHPVARKNLSAILRDEIRHLTELRQSGPVARGMEDRQIVDLETPSGLIVGQAVGIDLPLELSINTMRYVGRGLYYDRFGIILDPYAPVEAAYIPYEEREFAGGLLQRVGQETPIYMPTLKAGAGKLVEATGIAHISDEIPDAVTVIVPLLVEGDDLPAAWWAVIFNRHVTFLIGVEGYAASVASIHRGMNGLRGT